MKNSAPDRRVARTRQTLHAALIGLILEKGYDNVTVQEIVRRANVGRSTFYAHHGGKEGLLLSGLQELREEMLAFGAGRRGVRSREAIGFSGAFFAHAHGHRELYRVLVRHGGGAVVTAGIRRLLLDLVRREIAAARAAPRAGAVPPDALAHFVAESMFSLLLWWFERAPQLAPGEIDAIFRRLIMPALEAELQ